MDIAAVTAICRMSKSMTLQEMKKCLYFFCLSGVRLLYQEYKIYLHNYIDAILT